LDAVPLKYPVRAPWEIWVSESQERMLLVVPQRNVEAVKKIFEDELVEATVIGELTKERLLRLFYKNVVVAELEMSFLFTQPTTAKGALITKTKPMPLTFSEPANPQKYGELLKKILGAPNVASKESIVRRYDHEVKGSTAIKPMQGITSEGPGDAAVIRPLRDSWKGAVLSNGFNPFFSSDAYKMAASAIDEAIRNNVCVGGRRWALLDNFSWGNPNNEAQAGGLVAASKACYDYALAFKAPFISGKDSLHNECAGIAIPQTLVVSALGVIPDVRRAVTMDAKRAGNHLYVVGETKLELGGSHYCAALGGDARNAGVIPSVDGKKALALYEAVLRAMDAGCVRSCHDCSEGGLAVAAAEMAFAGGFGVEIDLTQVPRAPDVKRNDFVLFSESNSRLLIEVEPNHAAEFEAFLKETAFGCIGIFTQNHDFAVKTLGGTEIVRENVFELKRVWQKTLK
ncbi:MAG: AIR synthase-related protein, partial [Candidatus Norongarragalinales archaeon]